MKHRFLTPTGKIMLAVITVLVIAFAAALGFDGAHLEIRSVSSATSQHLTASHLLLQGKYTHTLFPETESAILQVNIETTGGSLYVRISDESGRILFDERDIATCSFDLGISTPVTIYMEAEMHRGRFEFNLLQPPAEEAHKT